MKLEPTAKQMETLGQLMSVNELALSSYRFSQVLPRSLLLRMATPYGPRIEKNPTSPRTKHVSCPGHLTRINGAVVTEDEKEFHVFPPSRVVAIAP
jgi:hypothetical protein